jgi:hypothetical protein
VLVRELSHRRVREQSRLHGSETQPFALMLVLALVASLVDSNPVHSFLCSHRPMPASLAWLAWWSTIDSFFPSTQINNNVKHRNCTTKNDVLFFPHYITMYYVTSYNNRSEQK